MHPTPPPVFSPAVYSDTRTSRLRRQHTQQCAKDGQFESQDVKDQLAISTHKQEIQRRAKAHVAQQQRCARQRIQETMEASKSAFKQPSVQIKTSDSIPSETFSDGPHKSDSAADTNLAKEDRLVEAHRKSRHRKIESDITNMTREILAEKGLDVLRFVEDTMTPRQMLDAVTESAPRTRAEVSTATPSGELALL